MNFEQRLSEFCNEYSSQFSRGRDATDLIVGANWCKAEMQLEIEDLKLDFKRVDAENEKLKKENESLRNEVRGFLIDGQEPTERSQEAAHYTWLDDQNEKLKEQIKDYEQALKIYAQESSWAFGKLTNLGKFVGMICLGKEGGYERAREVLKKWGVL